MKTRFVPLLVMAVLIVTALLAQPTDRVVAAAGLDRQEDTKQNREAIEDVWRAQMPVQMRGLPVLTLNITLESGSLNGAILFYLLRREPGKAETSTPGIPEPLMHPKLVGKVLTFAVSHRRAHGDSSKNDPPVRFSVTLTGLNKAELLREGTEHDGSSKIMLERESD